MQKLLLVFTASLALLACSEAPAPQEQAGADAKPAPAKAAASKPLSVQAPAGRYAHDPNHSSLVFSVNHLGLSEYSLRFTDFQATLDLDPADPAASAVSITIDPSSIRSDYAGDYKDGHEDSPFSTWDEDLAQSPKFLNAAEHPSISFSSKKVTPGGGNKLSVDGDLTLLGQTRPVNLQVTLVGDMDAHPFTGAGALGFSATGSFKRSDFGMDYLLNPPLVGDEITLRFDGEFHQVVEEASAEG